MAERASSWLRGKKILRRGMRGEFFIAKIAECKACTRVLVHACADDAEAQWAGYI